MDTGTPTTQLVPQTRGDAQAMIEAMSASEKAELSADWLARLYASTEMDPWVHGFRVVHRDSGIVVGACMFKGPPGDGVVEIAYGIDPDQQGKGYATEAAQALVAFALASGLVRLIRAHTLPGSSASKRVLAKSGFTYVGEVIDPDDGLVARFEKGGWRMKDQVCLITGGTDGIGKAAAFGLAVQGVRLLVHGRDPDKGARAVAELKARSGNPEIEFLQADFSSLAEVRRLAAAVMERTPRLDVLINNAGGIFAKRTVSKDGYEMTFAVNHLAPFLLTQLLLEAIRNGTRARIVTTASGAHRRAKIPFEDLQSTNRYSAMRAYGTSKLANILFTRTLAKRLQGTGVTATCLHPGFVRTNFGRDADMSLPVQRHLQAGCAIRAYTGKRRGDRGLSRDLPAGPGRVGWLLFRLQIGVALAGRAG